MLQILQQQKTLFSLKGLSHYYLLAPFGSLSLPAHVNSVSQYQKHGLSFQFCLTLGWSFSIYIELSSNLYFLCSPYDAPCTDFHVVKCVMWYIVTYVAQCGRHHLKVFCVVIRVINKSSNTILNQAKGSTIDMNYQYFWNPPHLWRLWKLILDAKVEFQHLKVDNEWFQPFWRGHHLRRKIKFCDPRSEQLQHLIFL